MFDYQLVIPVGEDQRRRVPSGNQTWFRGKNPKTSPCINDFIPHSSPPFMTFHDQLRGHFSLALDDTYPEHRRSIFASQLVQFLAEPSQVQQLSKAHFRHLLPRRLQNHPVDRDWLVNGLITSYDPLVYIICINISYGYYFLYILYRDMYCENRITPLRGLTIIRVISQFLSGTTFQAG